MRFLPIEAYAKVNAWRRRNILEEKDYKVSLRVSWNTSLGNNQMSDKVYINIDDVYAWNLLIINFL